MARHLQGICGTRQAAKDAPTAAQQQVQQQLPIVADNDDVERFVSGHIAEDGGSTHVHDYSPYVGMSLAAILAAEGCCETTISRVVARSRALAGRGRTTRPAPERSP